MPIRRSIPFMLDSLDRLRMTNLKQRRIMSFSPQMGNKKTFAVGVTFALCFMLIHLVSAPRTTAQAQNGISDPQEGNALSGIVSIQGTATDPDFLRYELAFNNGGDWLVFAEGDRPIINGTLALWDTTIGQPSNPVFPDGVYQLRLRVVRQDYNYDEYVINNLIVSNAMTPTPTGTATPADGSTRTLGTPEPGATATSGFIIIRPTALPSLTPFPTPSSPPLLDVVEAGTPAVPAGTDNAGEAGLLQRVLAVETERFSHAFWAGVQIAFYAFLLLALYVFLRAVFRYLWPRFWAWVNRKE